MTTSRRRVFLQGAAAGSVLAASSLLRTPHARATATKTARGRVLKRDPLGILELPEGFRVRVLERFGDLMDDGYRVPGRPDAMACMRGPSGEVVLMRNHENARAHAQLGPLREGQVMPALAYDPQAPGGVSRVVLDPTTRTRRSSNLVLAGTINNCAGGTSPWGWLSCEEWEPEPEHGFVFLCDPSASEVQAPRRLTGYGRFRHEAAAVDPKTRIAYLTEDQVDSAFYRFVPKSLDEPFDGKLQALAIEGIERLDTGVSMPKRSDKHDGSLHVRWVDIDEPNPSTDNVREQAHARGAAIIRRGEGLWLSDDSAYFTATIGGRAQRGQILRLRFDVEPNTLQVISEAPGDESLDMPDNITISPHGHIYVAEDGSGENWLRRITPDGRVIPFARNLISESELAGVCFSPEGETMFVNIQEDGLTLAIDGPFAADAAHDDEPPPSGPPHDPSHVGSAPGTIPSTALWIGGGMAALALAALVRRRNRT